MDRILALYGKDRLYMERLFLYFSHCDSPFRLQQFQSVDAIEDFSEKREIHVLLSTERLLLPGVKHPVYLSETPPGKDSSGPHEIYRYRSGSEILRELCRLYGEERRAPIEKDGRAKLYTVFSPIGRSGKTSLSLSLAKTLSASMHTLLLSFEETAGPASFYRGKEGSLTEALYYFKEGKLNALRLNSLCYPLEDTGFSVLPPVRNPEDLSALSASELADFTELLLSSSGFDAVVLDTDPLVSRIAPIFPLSERILIPVREDACSKRKLSQFIHYLEYSSLLGRPERFVKLLLPLTEGEDPASIAALPESLLSDFTLSLAKRCLLSPEEELLFQEAEEEETEEYEASEREDEEISLPLSEKLSESVEEEISEIDLCRGL